MGFKKKRDRFKDDGPRQQRGEVSAEYLEERNRLDNELELRFGFPRHTAGIADGITKRGWLLTIRPGTFQDTESDVAKSCLDMFFLTEAGGTFKASMPFMPYFYVGVSKDEYFMDVEAYLRRAFERKVFRVEAVEKEDLDLKNHLSGLTRKYLKLSFLTVSNLLAVRKELAPKVARNRKAQALSNVYEAFQQSATTNNNNSSSGVEDGFGLECVLPNK